MTRPGRRLKRRASVPTNLIILLQLFLWLLVLPSHGFILVEKSSPLATRNGHQQQLFGGATQPFARTSLNHLYNQPTRGRTLRPVVLLKMSSSKNKGDDDDDDDDGNATTATTDWAWLLTLCLPLWLVYVSNQWSRSSIYYLVDFSNKADAFTAMNVDIGFTQTEYGLLASVAFTSLFAIASLGAGIAADRLNRKSLTIASATAWSLATLGTAMAHSYPQVVLCRIAMGLACAFSTPTAYTLIRERAPPERVALASSLYGTGVAVASALASLSILLDTEYGWRNALNIVAAFGLVSVIISFLVLGDDPKEEAINNNNNNNNVNDDGEAPVESVLSFVDDVQDVVESTRVKWIFLASFLRFCSGLCIGVWGAPYFRMTFPSQESDFAVAQAGISAIGASLSGLLGGAIADWLVSQAKTQDARDPVGRRLWVPVVGSILAAPTWYFAVHSEGSFQTAMVWLGAEYFVAECWFGPTISTLQSTVAPKVGGTAQGLFTLTGGVANLAPSLLGYLYGQASGGSESSDELSSLLAFGVCFGYLSSAFCFGMAAQSSPPAQEQLLEKEKTS